MSGAWGDLPCAWCGAQIQIHNPWNLYIGGPLVPCPECKKFNTMDGDELPPKNMEDDAEMTFWLEKASNGGAE